MKTNWILTLMIPALIACGKGGFQSTSSEPIHVDLSFQQQIPEAWERIPARSTSQPAPAPAKPFEPAPVPPKPVEPAPAPGTQNPVDVPAPPSPAPQPPKENPPVPPQENPAPPKAPAPPKETPPQQKPPAPPKETPAPPKAPLPPKETPAPPKAPVPPKETPAPPKAPVPPKETPAPPKAPVPPKETPAPPKAPVPPKETPAPPKAPVPPKENPTPPKAPQPPKETPKPAPPPKVPAPSPEKPPQKPDEAYPNDFQFRGELTPTIYFHPLLRDEENNCKSGKWKVLRGAKGVELMTVCSTTLQVCAMEGTCQITRKARTRSFNYRGMSGGQYVFFELLPGDCTYGYGVKSSCLDPFYTVAADLKHHNPGDVIYIPKVAGVVLPNGKKHTGFFVVRDSGGMIKGSHRFDFYSGTLRWNDPRNPFYQIRLSDSNQRFSYSRVTGATAKKVLAERAYPKLPKAEAPKQMFSFENDGSTFLPPIF